MALLENPVTPDSRMTMPIDRLLYWAAQVVHRTKHYAQRDDLDDPFVRRMMEREDEFRRAYLTAIRVRAKEVADYLDAIGIYGATVEYVRDHPFEMALVAENKLREAVEAADIIIDIETAIELCHRGPWSMLCDWIGFRWWCITSWAASGFRRRDEHGERMVPGDILSGSRWRRFKDRLLSYWCRR